MPVARPMETAKIQLATWPCVVASMTMPVATPMGLEMANMKAYAKQERSGRFGSIRSSAMPMAIAAKILCRLMVHNTFHAVN
nr:unnamed protein product [Digitaria exilis]